MIFRIKPYYPILGIGLSYTPLQKIDWKNWFRCRIIDFTTTYNHFRFKLFFFDISIIWCTESCQHSDTKVKL